MNSSERNTQLLVEEICGPLDEILAVYKPDLTATQAQHLQQCRDILEAVLVAFEQDPTNPDAHV